MLAGTAGAACASLRMGEHVHVHRGKMAIRVLRRRLHAPPSIPGTEALGRLLPAQGHALWSDTRAGFHPLVAPLATIAESDDVLGLLRWPSAD